MDFGNAFKQFLNPLGDAGDILSIVLKFVMYGAILGMILYTCYKMWANFAALQDPDIDEGAKKAKKKNIAMGALAIVCVAAIPFVIATLYITVFEAIDSGYDTNAKFVQLDNLNLEVHNRNFWIT